MSSTIHASAVALSGRGALLIGPSGSGKTGLALQFMALGGKLVADDVVQLTLEGMQIYGAHLAGGAGLIEIEGAGIFRLPAAYVLSPARIDMVIMLTAKMDERYPSPQWWEYRGLSVPCYQLQASHPAAAAKLWALLQSEKVETLVPDHEKIAN